MAQRGLQHILRLGGPSRPPAKHFDLFLPQGSDEIGLARRRPADIHLPCFRGALTALDLAITACQRMNSLGGEARRGSGREDQVPVDGAGEHGGRGPDPAGSRPRCCRAGRRSAGSTLGPALPGAARGCSHLLGPCCAPAPA